MRRDMWWLVVLCLGMTPAHAETVYVTDKLQVGLRAARDGAVVKPVETGTALEVLERDERFVRVRDRQGSEGWLETRHVSAEVPARLQLVKLQDELNKARAQLAEVQAQPRNAAAAESDTEYELDYLWLAIGLAMLIAGFIAGIVWHRESIRRRMGGMYLRI